jgi:uncharacterized membrane protein
VLTEIDIDLPVRTVYNQWTQFEDFPIFMRHIEEVHQIDADRLHWKAKMAGQTREWDARITEQVPDERIAWQATDGTPNAGAVTFHRLDADHTRVVLQLDVEPEGFLETVADKGGLIADRAESDLERFKAFIERRGHETGGYRGSITGADGDDGRAHLAEFGGDDEPGR